MRKITPLKVKIGLRENGRAKYPNFNLLACTGSTDWAIYVDKQGLGWHYDKTSGHKNETIDSPIGTQYGVLLVPQIFADQAVTQFPIECSKLSEAELEAFYNEKSHINEPDEEIDEKVVNTIKAKNDLGLALTAEQQKAIDPTDRTRGIRKNLNKNWADYKKENNLQIV